MNNSNMINFNFISYVLILVGKVLMTQFGKKEKIINYHPNVKLKLFKNSTKPIRSFVHPRTLDTFSLYNDANSISLQCYVSM